MDMLRVTDVRKSFGSKVVVDGLSFSIPKNWILAGCAGILYVYDPEGIFTILWRDYGP